MPITLKYLTDKSTVSTMNYLVFWFLLISSIYHVHSIPYPQFSDPLHEKNKLCPISVIYPNPSYLEVTPRDPPTCALNRGGNDQAKSVASYTSVYQQFLDPESGSGVMISLLSAKMEFWRSWFISKANSTSERYPSKINQMTQEAKLNWNQVIGQESDWFKMNINEKRIIPLEEIDYPYVSTLSKNVFYALVQKVTLSWSVTGTLIDPINKSNCLIGKQCVLSDSSILLTRKVNFDGCALAKLSSHPAMVYLYEDYFKILALPHYYEITIKKQNARTPVCSFKGRENIFLSDTGIYFSLDKGDRLSPFCVLAGREWKTECQGPYPTPLIGRQKRDLTRDLSVVPLDQKLNWIFSHSLLELAHSTEIRNSLLNATLTDLEQLRYQNCKVQYNSLLLARSLINWDPIPYLREISSGREFLFRQTGNKLYVHFGKIHVISLNQLLSNNFQLTLEGFKCRLSGNYGLALCGDHPDHKFIDPELIPLSEGGSWDIKRNQSVTFKSKVQFHLRTEMEEQGSITIENYVKYSTFGLNEIESAGSAIPMGILNQPNSESLWLHIAQGIINDKYLFRGAILALTYLIIKFVLDFVRSLRGDEAKTRRGFII